jgi:peptidoglycan L-alanyl-D-glutamate endopeptidase CwlK
MNLNERSLKNLVGVHPDLVQVVKLAAQHTKLDFIVTEGIRTKARKAELVKAGASRTMKSRHLTGHAVDLAATVGGTVRWDWPLYSQLAETMKAAAKDLSIAIEWGGDWTSFKDGPHFQLPFSAYPAEE